MAVKMAIPPRVGMAPSCESRPNLLLKIILSLGVAFAITAMLVPVVVSIVKEKGVVAHENGRTSHTGSIPTMGGDRHICRLPDLGLVFSGSGFRDDFRYVIAGAVFMLMVGMKDDIQGITPWMKLAGQIIAALIIIVPGDIRFTSLQGFLGIEEISYFWSVVISLVTIVGLTNCFNLIDGIDGLASGIGTLVSITLGIWFGLAGQYGLMFICLALVGSLIAFSIYNIWGKENKIFMGDTGSLVLGFILAALVIEFNELNVGVQTSVDLISTPAISIGIMIVPVFDTLRVFILRMWRRKHPFSPDKTHTHHNLINLGASHHKATLSLMFLNGIFIAISFALNSLGATILLTLIMALALLAFYLPIFAFRFKDKDSTRLRTRLARVTSLFIA